jgi:hypothetical protein
MYKTSFKIFLILCLASNLFADTNNTPIEQQEKSEDKIVAYLGLEKNVSKNVLKKETKRVFLTGYEQELEKKSDDDYEINGVFSMEKKLSNKQLKQYNITGVESKFDLSDRDLKNIYDIDGTESFKYSKKLFFTKYQKAQIDYLEMERKYKTLVLDKEISLKKQLLDEELTNEFADVFFIDELSKDIKSLAVDKETVNINVDKKIRYVLTPDQYLKYKQKQNKK